MFGSFSWFWRCKEYPCPLSPDLGLLWGLEVPDWDRAFNLDIFFIGFYTQMFQIFTLYLHFEGSTNFHDLEVLILVFYGGCRFLTRILHLGLYLGIWYTYMVNFGSLWILKVQRTSAYFKSCFESLVGPEGSWLEFGILILILKWSLVFNTPIFQILDLSGFWRCKEHPCPLCLYLELWWGLEV